ncbi:MAG: hypothetical protein K5761_00145, partial [Clostridiales bacterium]|nr:hypothetical protein [Clostridiales bacterium]
ADKKQAREEIMNMCKKTLDDYAIPTKIEFLDKLPLTNMGKIAFTELEKTMNEKKESTSNV